MSVTLALEASARPPSIAVRAGARVAVRRLGAERRHASDLLPSLSSALEELGRAPADLERIVVGLGPGSFTGLRVAVATALGLARATGAALLGLPSFEALAWSELHPGDEAVVLGDARAGEAYLARYRRTEDDVVEVEAPCVLPARDVAARLPRAGAILADATVATAAGLDAAGLDASVLERLRAGCIPDAEALLRLAPRRFATHGPTPPERLQPLYLRPFAAAMPRR